MSGYDKTRLSRVLSHALRHAPQDYGLSLDEEGFVALSLLVEALKRKDPSFATLSEDDVRNLTAHATKKRHEIVGNRIRARYGHSVEGASAGYGLTAPPAFLWHGTSPEAAAAILKDALRPMRRQFVHLSATIDLAMIVGRRKAPSPKIIKVRAGEAHSAGVGFREVGDGVWLSGAIPAGFLSLEAAPGPERQARQ